MSSLTFSLTDKQVNLICVLYAVLSVVCIAFLHDMSWSIVQIRISEALCVIALLSHKSISKLTLGCVFANLVCMLIYGTWPLGILDVVFGGAATFLGAVWCWYFKDTKVSIALFGFVLFNAVLIGAYLPFMLDGSAYMFLGLDFSGNYFMEVLVGMGLVGMSEAISIYALGLPFLYFLKKSAK